MKFIRSTKYQHLSILTVYKRGRICNSYEARFCGGTPEQDTPGESAHTSEPTMVLVEQELWGHGDVCVPLAWTSRSLRINLQDPSQIRRELD